jgi:hypothetical protein
MIRPLLCLGLAALCLTPALAQEASLKKQAQKLHALAGGDWCEPERAEGWEPEETYQQWDISFTRDWDGAEEETVTLVRMFCMAGAYNVQHSYYIKSEYEGLLPLAFATPTFETEYENDDSLDGELVGLTVTGMGAVTTLTNSSYDPETQTIYSNASWRGIGDASSIGTWAFRDGIFTLVRFEIDASYDGEVNPETVVEYE